MLNSQSTGPVELSERQLSDVQGGLLLPAVQKVREAAVRMSSLTANDDHIATDIGSN